MNKTHVNIFFYSDPHFGHLNVIKFCKRPFKSIEHMTESLIKSWNEVVGRNDVTYVLGDIFFYLSDAQRKSIINRLNGRKILIKGNHDKGNTLSKRYNWGFHAVVEEADIYIANQRVKLSHYPYRHSLFVRLKIRLKGNKKKDKHFEKRPVDVFSKGQGCDHCLGAGYLGRTAVYEFILVTDRIRELIVQKVAEGEILKELKRTGFKTIIENGLEKVAEGITSLEEISNIIEFSDDIHRSVENVLKTNPILLYANTKKSSPMTKLAKKSRIEDIHPQPRRFAQGNLEREIV